MPLGDSIADSPGCRRAMLWNQLQDVGHTDIDFVGTLPGRSAATPANIVVLHFGTNEVWSSLFPDRVLAAWARLVARMARMARPILARGSWWPGSSR